jgi:hypothetical protein
MEIIMNSIKKVFFGAMVLVLNIPIFWSFTGFIHYIRNILKITGQN